MFDLFYVLSKIKYSVHIIKEQKNDVDVSFVINKCRSIVLQKWALSAQNIMYAIPSHFIFVLTQ